MAKTDDAALRRLGHGEKMMAARDRDVARQEAREIIRSVCEIQTLESISDQAMAGILAISRAAWNKTRRGTYRGNVQKILKRARAWLAERADQAPIEAGEYVPTSIGRAILTVCTGATRRQTIGLIVTPAGAGKTVALREYARRLGDKAILLAGGEACHAKASIAWELAGALGVAPPKRGSTVVVYQAVRKQLAARYAGGRAAPVTILLDEATSVMPGAVNLLRNLHDDPRCRCPLVLADTWRLDEQLHSARGLPGGYEQLRSRAGRVWRLAVTAEIPAADVRSVADAVLVSMGRRRALPAGSYRYLHERVANRPVREGRSRRLALRDGALRNVMQRLHAVADVAEAAGREARYSVSEMDAVAPLVGQAMQHPAAPDPFVTEPSDPGDEGHGRPARRAG